MQTLPYLEFQTAQVRHHKPLSELEHELQQSIRDEARRQWQLEETILATAEAAACVVEAVSLEQALQNIRGRYPDQADFLADMETHGLDEALLRDALERELRVDAVLTRIATSAPKVSEQDAEIFYWAHLERFKVAQARQARHILVTINDTVPGNRREEALARIESVAAQLARDPERFADLALQYSECPTALQNGELGWVAEGQLYPELDAALFAMETEQLSGVLESPLGFHVLHCQSIRPAATRTFDEVRDKLMASLQANRERLLQKNWVRSITQSHPAKPHSVQ